MGDIPWLSTRCGRSPGSPSSLTARPRNIAMPVSRLRMRVDSVYSVCDRRAPICVVQANS